MALNVRFGNPHSPHRMGRQAKAAVEMARDQVAALFPAGGKVIFTSGASEALWIALNRAKVERRIVSAVEHDAVLRAAPGADILPVLDRDADAAGEPDCDFLADYLARPGKAVVAIQAINSETGTCLIPYARPPAIDLVRAATSAGQVTMLYLHNSEADRTVVRQFENLLFRADTLGDVLGIKLRMFHCGQIDISKTPAMKAFRSGLARKTGARPGQASLTVFT